VTHVPPFAAYPRRRGFSSSSCRLAASPAPSRRPSSALAAGAPCAGSGLPGVAAVARRRPGRSSGAASARGVASASRPRMLPSPTRARRGRSSRPGRRPVSAGRRLSPPKSSRRSSRGRRQTSSPISRPIPTDSCGEATTRPSGSPRASASGGSSRSRRSSCGTEAASGRRCSRGRSGSATRGARSPPRTPYRPPWSSWTTSTRRALPPRRGRRRFVERALAASRS
jgi:hypothetical protein